MQHERVQADIKREVRHLLLDSCVQASAAVSQGHFSAFDATLGDTQCQLRAFYIYTVHEEHFKHADLTQLLNQQKDLIDVYLSLFLGTGKGDMEQCIDSMCAHWSDERFHLFNFAMLLLLKETSVAQRLYHVCILSKTCEYIKRLDKTKISRKWQKLSSEE